MFVGRQMGFIIFKVAGKRVERYNSLDIYVKSFLYSPTKRNNIFLKWVKFILSRHKYHQFYTIYETIFITDAVE